MGMRIIAGELRHRKLFSPPEGSITRPIPDRVKESVFNLLRGHFEGSAMLDAFAGVGAIGLEAISRGAERVVMVERDRKVAEILERNASELGVRKKVEIVIGDALGPGALARCPRPLHLAFFDPPYDMARDKIGYKRIKAQFEAAVQLLDDTGYAILRTPWPFLHEEPVESDPTARLPELGERERRKPEKKRGPRSMREIEELERFGEPAEMFEEEIEELDAELDEELEVTPPPAKGKVTEVDLAMLGALGPETHVYGSTAVHLYMKRP